MSQKSRVDKLESVVQDQDQDQDEEVFIVWPEDEGLAESLARARRLRPQAGPVRLFWPDGSEASLP